MAAITYTASSRAPLVTTDSPAHTAGGQYSIDVKMQAFNEGIETPKTKHISISGQVETVLRRATSVMAVTFIWPPTLNVYMQEFLFSIAGGEAFSFDPYGTVAVPDDVLSVKCLNESFSIGRMTHGQAHWRSVSLQLRAVV